MTRVSIVFCGLVRDPEVLKLAFATAVVLRAQGKVHRLLLSTWHGEIERVPDGRALLRALDVELVESAFPPALAVKGNVFQQMLSMDRALDQIDDDDLVLRTRTDIVFLGVAALEAVVTQDLALGPQLLDERGGAIFGGRIWVPYFHPLMPFYFADQLYFGRAADLRRLNNYDFLPEAYQITSRPHELHPGHSSGAAAEIRRFLKPFLEKFPVLREYAQVWPKHCVGTALLCEVLAYNLASPLYRQYMALSLAMTYRYFRVGQIPAADDRVLVLAGGDGHLLQLRMSLVHNDQAVPAELEFGLAGDAVRRTRARPRRRRHDHQSACRSRRLPRQCGPPAGVRRIPARALGDRRRPVTDAGPRALRRRRGPGSARRRR
jgi:hypothetical protein